MSHPRRWIFAAALLVPAMLSAQSRSAKADSLGPVARRALDAPGVQWKKQQTKHADLYVLSGSSATHLSGRLARDAERAIAQNLAWLGGRPAPARLRLFFVGSRDEMKPFTGKTSGGTSETAEGTAFFVANDSIHPALRHETMHLLSWRMWGTPAGEWMSEGLATLAVGNCRGQSPEQIVAAMRGAGLLVPLDDLRKNFVFGGEVGVIDYYEAATLVHYIDRTYGRKRLRDMWTRGGLARTMETLGVDLDKLEKDWRASLQRTTPKSSWAAIWKEIQAHGCE